MAKRWDTPTDGISRKVFDRAMDSHIRRYATAMSAIRDLEVAVKAILALLADPSSEEIEEE